MIIPTGLCLNVLLQPIHLHLRNIMDGLQVPHSRYVTIPSVLATNVGYEKTTVTLAKRFAVSCLSQYSKPCKR